MSTTSYSLRTASSARLSLSSRLKAGTSSISAPARSRVAGTTKRFFRLVGSTAVERGRVVHQHVVDRGSTSRGLMPRPVEALPWGSRSTTRTRKPDLGQGRAEVHRGGGLAHAALLVGDGDDPRQRAAGSAPWAPGRRSATRGPRRTGPSRDLGGRRRPRARSPGARARGLGGPGLRLDGSASPRARSSAAAARRAPGSSAPARRPALGRRRLGSSARARARRARRSTSGRARAQPAGRSASAAGSASGSGRGGLARRSRPRPLSLPACRQAPARSSVGGSVGAAWSSSSRSRPKSRRR